MYSRRLQGEFENISCLIVSLFFDIIVQERLTKEIAEAVLSAIQPTGVGVVVEAT
jgi:GTP cyclohydrolase I